MEKSARKNPWLGLESYKEGEILYGRDDDIRDLTQCVLNDDDTLLYGKSGIGKSSILNAGILPAARRNGYLPILIRLSHKDASSYLSQIRDAIANALCPLPTDEAGMQIELTPAGAESRRRELSSRIRETVPAKDKDKEILYEYFHRHTFHADNGDRIKLLIIFDQFEEIFTLQDNAQKKKKFFSELADMLNDIMPDELQGKVMATSDSPEEIRISETSDLESLFDDLNLETENAIPEYVTDNEIHFVFTIREDFLSEFEYYTAAIPSLKQNRYGLRPINEEQACQIIMRPMPGLIDKTVARLIIEKITGEKDFSLDGVPEIEVDSAVLSLYLNRLYDARTGDIITADLIEQKGGEIISDFYNDAISCISEHSVEYLEDALLNGQGRRDNITVYDAVNEGKVSESELDILCNRKKILRLFNYSGDLRIEYVHDILCPVVKEHKEERILIKRQEEEKKKQEELQKKLLLEEERKRKEIERKAALEKQRLEEEARRIKEKNRRRVVSIITTVAIVAALVSFVWINDYNENRKLHEEFYAAFENIGGWPAGIGDPLEEHELYRTPLYYRLSHRGNRNGDRHTDVEIMSSNEFPPNVCRAHHLEWSENPGKDTSAAAFNRILSNVARIRYSSSGASGQIGKEELLDRNDSILMTISYFHLSDNDAWAQFYTAKGQNMKIRQNGLDRIRLSWDSDGRIKSLMYYDAAGVPQDITAGTDVNGYLWERSRDTTVQYLLNEVGLLSAGVPVNTILSVSNEDTLETRFYFSTQTADKNARETANSSGWSRMVAVRDTTWFYSPDPLAAPAVTYTEHDRHGNVTGIRTSGNHRFRLPAYIGYEYEKGLIVKEERLTENGTPYTTDSTSLYKWEYGYDNEGNIIKEIRTDTSGVAYSYRTDSRQENGCTIRTTEIFDKTGSPAYLIRTDTLMQDFSSTAFYGKNRERLNRSLTVRNDTLPVCRFTTLREGNTVTTEYYAYADGKTTPLQAKTDANGRARTYHRRIENFDEDGNMISMRLEDENGNIIKSMMYFIQNGQTIGRAVMGIDGNAVRCDRWEEEGYLYYKLYYSKNFDDFYCGISAVDEWNRNSAFYDPSTGDYIRLDWFQFKDRFVSVFENLEALSSGTPFIHTQIFNTYNQVVFNEDRTVSDMEIPYIHVLSPESGMYAGKAGVKDGDRIIRLGLWESGDPADVFEKEWARAISQKSVDITVLRPDTDGYTEKRFSLGCADNEEELIEYHILKMTHEEKEFLEKHLQKP